MSVGVIDYEAGNLRSIETALEYLGATYVVSGDPDRLADCSRLVIPGVGDAAAAMDTLRARGLDRLILDFAGRGLPVFGICLGAQIVLDSSEENGARCLGLIPGRARAFRPTRTEKVPHIGWNRAAPKHHHHPLFNNLPEDASFYFVHSFYPEPESESDVLAQTEYGVRFASAIARENVWAVQFHPEKSGRYGLRMLANYLDGAVHGDGAPAGDAQAGGTRSREGDSA